MRILICEDDHALAELWADHMKPLGYEIEIAHTLAAAIEAMRRIPPPDLLFLDLVLPDSRDAEVTLRDGVRLATNANPNVVIVVITGMNSERIADIAAEIGADGFNFKNQVASQRSLWQAVQAALVSRVSSPRKCAEDCLLLVEKLNGLLTAPAQ